MEGGVVEVPLAIVVGLIGAEVSLRRSRRYLALARRPE